MGVRQSIVRGFLKLNIFARTPKMEESEYITEKLKNKEEVVTDWFKEYRQKETK